MTLGPLMIDLQGAELQPEERELLQHPLVGGVIFFSRNYVDPPQLLALTEQVRATRSPPLLLAVDHEGGRVQRFRQHFSKLPALRRIGQAFDLDTRQGLELARQMGWLMAAELRSFNIDLSFAPCVDLDYGISEVIGDRAFHRRSEVVAQLAIAYMHGMRDAGMPATAKHFPGHGAVVADSHVAVATDRRPYVDLVDDLAPYHRLIANGLPGVLVAHVLFPEVDDKPASVSPRWVQQILRAELAFQGAVFTDDMSMVGASIAGDAVSRSRQALAAGSDMVLICNSRNDVISVLDNLRVTPEPASQLRLVRMRGKDGLSRDELLASDSWQVAKRWLARATGTPDLDLL
jgi:beta-N-acetylhexosaminidase